MQKFNPPNKQDYIEYLTLKESKRKDLYDKAELRLSRIQDKIDKESAAIIFAKQIVPFREKLQFIADAVVGKWAFLEPGTTVNFGEKPTTLKNPMILYGLSLKLTHRIALPGEDGWSKNLVGKDGKIVDLAFGDMRFLSRIRFDTIMLTNKVARIIPSVIYDEYMQRPKEPLVNAIDLTLTKDDSFNRCYHIIKDMTTADAKEKCTELLKANKDRLLGTLGNDREKIIKAYDYITENIGTDKFDGETVMKLFGVYA